MIKTIFYIKENEESENSYFFNNKPYKEWKVLENYLYDIPNNCLMETKGEDGYIKKLTPSMPQDRFTDSDIIRRIFLW